jgi:SecD/SecF fusion protein
VTVPAAFVLTALAVPGGDALTDFALVLLVGLAVGTWSSSCTGAHGRAPRRGRGTLGRPGGGLRGP